MKIGILGNKIKETGDDILKLQSLEEAENKANDLDLIIIGSNFPSCNYTRDIVMKPHDEISAQLKKKNSNLKVIFMAEKG